jgi:hypothetical protein
LLKNLGRNLERYKYANKHAAPLRHPPSGVGPLVLASVSISTPSDHVNHNHAPRIAEYQRRNFAVAPARCVLPDL